MGDTVEYHKLYATGNDFILFDNRDGKFSPHKDKYDRLHELCRRQTGIGADAILVIENHPSLDYSFDFYEADGTPGQLCGNGSRATVLYAHMAGIFDGTTTTFQAFDGAHRATYDDTTNMVTITFKDIDQIRKIDENNFYIMNGNQYHVRFMSADEVERLDVPVQAEKLCSELYNGDRKINFVFAADPSSNNTEVVRMFTYLTQSGLELNGCGTGACAGALVQAVKTGLQGRKTYTIKMRSTELAISCTREKDGGLKDITMSGPVSYVFSGRIKM